MLKGAPGSEAIADHETSPPRSIDEDENPSNPASGTPPEGQEYMEENVLSPLEERSRVPRFGGESTKFRGSGPASRTSANRHPSADGSGSGSSSSSSQAGSSGGGNVCRPCPSSRPCPSYNSNPASSAPNTTAAPVLSRHSDIPSVIQKAKKAAFSLFRILHAQSCSDPNCGRVQGCTEAKKILLHIKQCAVGPQFSCPVPGCNQVRKLLSHYRRCSDLRRRASPDMPHQCLVCSLLSREVKTFQQSAAASGRKSNRSPLIARSSANLMPRKNERKHRTTYPGGYPAVTNHTSNCDNLRVGGQPRSCMPPPPPRSFAPCLPLPQSIGCSPLHSRVGALQRRPGASLSGSYGSPPTIPDHMKTNINSISNVVDATNDLDIGGSSDRGGGGAEIAPRDVLGKSVDTAINGFQGMPGNERPDPSRDLASPERKIRRLISRERSVSAGDASETSTSSPSSPASPHVSYGAESACPSAPQPVVLSYISRRRSVSCGMLTNGRTFSTIPEGIEEGENEGSE